jgi:hypothetical protein
MRALWRAFKKQDMQAVQPDKDTERPGLSCFLVFWGRF